MTPQNGIGFVCFPFKPTPTRVASKGHPYFQQKTEAQEKLCAIEEEERELENETEASLEVKSYVEQCPDSQLPSGLLPCFMFFWEGFHYKVNQPKKDPSFLMATGHLRIDICQTRRVPWYHIFADLRNPYLTNSIEPNPKHDSPTKMRRPVSCYSTCAPKFGFVLFEGTAVNFVSKGCQKETIVGIPLFWQFRVCLWDNLGGT